MSTYPTNAADPGSQKPGSAATVSSGSADPGSGVSGVFKTLRALFLVEHLDLPRATSVPDAEWEPFQIAHLNNDAAFGIECKSRQIAWSWTIAAEALADAVLSSQSSLFVSINQEEAGEKIRYARSVYEALEGVNLPRIVGDSKTVLELSNGARIISLPSRPPRGKPKFNVYLDEYAHAQNDRAIYQAAPYVMSKGGRLRIGSSPLGAQGMFWEIFEQRLRLYPDFTRRVTQWWKVAAFCTDIRAATNAAKLGATTEELVEQFGKPKIKLLYRNTPSEDFEQEMCCKLADESTAWITWNEIRSVQNPDLQCVQVKCVGNDVVPVVQAIQELVELIRKQHCESILVAGMDIGRTKHATEIFICGITGTGRMPLRLMITLEKTPFPEQYQTVCAVLASLPVVAMLIDKTGLGMQLAEQAEKDWPGRVAGVSFTVGTKALWATNAKKQFQNRNVDIPVDRDLAIQLHSIKKIVTPSRNVLFDVARNEKHHADKTWSLWLAWAAATAIIPQEDTIVVFSSNVFISST